MEIKKEYKFYYGHRNQELNDKCFHIHGHDAKIFIVFEVVRTGAISTLFNDFDKEIEPWFKDQFDHKLAIDENDDLLPYLKQYELDKGRSLGLNILPLPTSVENMCFMIFNHIITQFGFKVNRIEYQETRTSTVIYTKEDYKLDFHKFQNKIS